MKAWADEAIRRKHPSGRGFLLQAALIHVTIGVGFLPWVESRLLEKTSFVGDM